MFGSATGAAARDGVGGAKRQAQEDRVGRFLSGWENFFDLQAGAKQKNNDPNPLGKEIRGNVYTSDRFKIRLGGSLRLHAQHNDTPVGESVSSAPFPDLGSRRGK